VLKEQAVAEENSWKLPIQGTDQERWRRAEAIFAAHPWLTGFYFFLSGVEHALHPSPSVLSPGKLNFSGDYWALAGLWAMFLIFAGIGWWHRADQNIVSSETSSRWLTVLLLICLALTFSSGLCFGAGSRYRVSLELIIPLLAASGLMALVSPGRLTVK
jgi:hypothetical protein